MEWWSGLSSAGILSERVEARRGWLTVRAFMPVVGYTDETSEREEGSAVYPSFARLGASRSPQSVQVETVSHRATGGV